MSETERIIWRAETRERVEKNHPEYDDEQVTAFVNHVEAVGETKGFFD